MKAVRVQYTVQPDYVATNQQNIETVMQELRAIGNPGLRYSAYLLEDGQTFMHIAMFADEAANKVLNELPSFAAFRQALKASQPIYPPKAEDISLVGASWEMFAPVG